MEILSVDSLKCNLKNITHTLTSDGIKFKYLNKDFLIEVSEMKIRTIFKHENTNTVEF